MLYVTMFVLALIMELHGTKPGVLLSHDQLPSLVPCSSMINASTNIVTYSIRARLNNMHTPNTPNSTAPN